jgi:VWFA-related protein
MAGLTAGLCLVAAAPFAQQAPQQPTFRSGIDVIAVDVQAVDNDGNPIQGLLAEHFTVEIDGRRRRVVSASFVPHGPSAAGPVGMPAPAGSFAATDPSRVFMLAVDVASFNVGDSRGVVAAARDFIRQLPPDERVGLYTFPLGPRMAPTTDRVALGQAIEAVVGQKQSLRSRYNLTASEVIDINSENAQLASQLPGPARGQPVVTALRGDETDTIRRVQIRECGTTDMRCVEDIRIEASAMGFMLEGQLTESMSGLSAVVQQVSQYPGRKMIVVLSGGMAASDRPGGRPDGGDVAKTLGREAAQANATIYSLFIDNGDSQAFSAERRRMDRSPSPRLREAMVLGRVLEDFALGSGGAFLRVIIGSGEQAFARVIRETSGFYLLGVEPAAEDRNGRQRALKVRVTQPGVTIRSRMWVTVPRSTSATR